MISLSTCSDSQLWYVCLCMCVCTCVYAPPPHTQSSHSHVHTHKPHFHRTSEPEVYLFIYLFIYFFVFSRAAPTACGDSQARGLIRAVTTGLCQSHSNVGSELRLQPTPQLMATPDP